MMYCRSGREETSGRTMLFERLTSPRVPDDVVVVSVWENHGRVLGDVVCMHCAARGTVAAEFPRALSMSLPRAWKMAEECGLSKVLIAAVDDAAWAVVEQHVSLLEGRPSPYQERVQN